jgi:hypothetical protein
MSEDQAHAHALHTPEGMKYMLSDRVILSGAMKVIEAAAAHFKEDSLQLVYSHGEETLYLHVARHYVVRDGDGASGPVALHQLALHKEWVVAAPDISVLMAEMVQERDNYELKVQRAQDRIEVLREKLGRVMP